METSVSSFGPVTLGTVQLGQAYGVANPGGMPGKDVAMKVLDAAWNGGVRSFDTARIYGQAEDRIGSWLAARGHRPHLITKVTKLGDDAASTNLVRYCVSTSMAALNVDFIDGLMMHSAQDIFRPGVLDSLEKLKTDGVIGGFGISAYAPEDVDKALTVPSLSLVQVPFNLFDRRMETSGVLDRCIATGVTVFARSLFLQGLFFLNPETLPDYLSAAAEPLRQLRAYADDLGRSVAEVALVAVRDTPGVASLVVGAECADQVKDTLAISKAAPLSSAERKAVFHIGDGLPERIYHPGLWG